MLDFCVSFFFQKVTATANTGSHFYKNLQYGIFHQDFTGFMSMFWSSNFLVKYQLLVRRHDVLTIHNYKMMNANSYSNDNTHTHIHKLMSDSLLLFYTFTPCQKNCVTEITHHLTLIAVALLEEGNVKIYSNRSQLSFSKILKQ